MPGYDKTGPRGDGPMTGGGQGRCAQGNRRASFNRYQGIRPGNGRMRGMGLGLSRMAGSEPPETESLKSEISSLKDMISQLGRKIADLEKSKQA